MRARSVSDLAADVRTLLIGFGCDQPTADTMANRIAKLESRVAEAEHPFDKSEYDAMYERMEAAEAERDYLRERGDKNARRAQAAEAQVAALTQERDKYKRWTREYRKAWMREQGWREAAEKVES